MDGEAILLLLIGSLCLFLVIAAVINLVHAAWSALIEWLERRSL